MVAIFWKTNSRRKDGSLKRLAGRETAVVVPVVVEPVEVEVPAVAVEVEVRDIEVAVSIAQKYAMRHLYHRPLSTLGVE